MKPVIDIVEVSGPSSIEDARALFREYEAWLGMDVCFQGFEAELAELPGRYAPPDGALLVAYSGGSRAGCVAIRKLDEATCEMKRLYLRPEFQDQGMGKRLVETTMDTARARGFSRIRLDTYPAKMGKAVSLYEAHGFIEIPPYYENPHDGVLFMEASLLPTDRQ